MEWLLYDFLNDILIGKLFEFGLLICIKKKFNGISLDDTGNVCNAMYENE